MSKRPTTFWIWLLVGFWLLAAAVALVVPAFAFASNCGGNSSALSVCRSIGLGFRVVALDRNESPFSVSDLTATERSNFIGVGRSSSLPDARFLVTEKIVNVGVDVPRQIIAVCD